MYICLEVHREQLASDSVRHIISERGCHLLRVRASLQKIRQYRWAKRVEQFTGVGKVLCGTVAYMQAPVVKFVYHLLSYIIFLVLLSYVALFGLSAQVLDWPEVMLSIWVAGLLGEEIIKVLACPLPSPRLAISSHMRIHEQGKRGSKLSFLQHSAFLYLTHVRQRKTTYTNFME